MKDLEKQVREWNVQVGRPLQTMKQNDLAHSFTRYPIPCGHGPLALVPCFTPPGPHWRMFPIPFGELLATVIALIRLMAGR